MGTETGLLECSQSSIGRHSCGNLASEIVPDIAISCYGRFPHRFPATPCYHINMLTMHYMSSLSIVCLRGSSHLHYFLCHSVLVYSLIIKMRIQAVRMVQ